MERLALFLWMQKHQTFLSGAANNNSFVALAKKNKLQRMFSVDAILIGKSV